MGEGGRERGREGGRERAPVFLLFRPIRGRQALGKKKTREPVALAVPVGVSG